MRKLVLTLPIFLILLALALPLAAQESSESHHTEHASEAFQHHRLAILLAHTHVPAHAQKDGLFIPSWGLDYEYWLNHRLGIGLHSDLELQAFLVEQEGGAEDIEREYPLLFTLDLLWKPLKDKGLVIEIGPGYELEKSENLMVIRAGLSYEFELPRHWDIAPTLFYDSRADAYDAYTLGLVVGKRF